MPRLSSSCSKSGTHRVASAGFTIVLRCAKPQGTVGQRGGHLPAKLFIFDGFVLIWCNFKFEAVLLLSDSRHYNGRVDSLPDLPLQGPSRGSHN